MIYIVYTHAIHIHNSQLASSLSSSTACGVVLECGCEYYGRSVDAAGGRGSVEKISSRWRRLPASELHEMSRMSEYQQRQKMVL